MQVNVDAIKSADAAGFETMRFQASLREGMERNGSQHPSRATIGYFSYRNPTLESGGVIGVGLNALPGKRSH
jgi:hypothetical protein